MGVGQLASRDDALKLVAVDDHSFDCGILERTGEFRHPGVRIELDVLFGDNVGDVHIRRFVPESQISADDSHRLASK